MLYSALLILRYFMRQIITALPRAIIGYMLRYAMSAALLMSLSMLVTRMLIRFAIIHAYAFASADIYATAF